MFKRPSAQNTDTIIKKRLHQPSASDPVTPSTASIQAVPIRRTDFRRIDPSLAAPVANRPVAPDPSSQVILQGKELQDYLNKQKKKQAASQSEAQIAEAMQAEALQDLVENHEITDPQAQQMQELMQDQIVAAAAVALSQLPARKRQLVVDLINQLRENDNK